MQGKLSSPLETELAFNEHVPPRHSCLSSSWEKLFKMLSGSPQNVGVELASGRSGDLDYADNRVCWFRSAEHEDYGLDRPARAVAPLDKCLSPSQGKVLLRDWVIVVSNFILGGEKLATFGRFCYTDSFLIKNGTKLLGSYRACIKGLSCVR